MIENKWTSRIILFSLFFIIAVLLQWRGNAFGAEFGGSSDEPAHYITGLMVRDYLASGLSAAPFAFARDYYVHYPKVALGQWPPFFYVVQAIWTLVFSPSRISVILLMAAITVLLATTVCEALRQDLSLAAGAGTAVVFVALPFIERFAQMVTPEMLMALLAFLAILAYGGYLDTGRWQASAWFGVWCTCALLTKGTGIALALVPPFSVLLTRRWNLIRRFSFWLPVLPVLLFAVPWYLWVPGAQHQSVRRFGGLVFQAYPLLSTWKAWAVMLGPGPGFLALLGVLTLIGPIARGSAAGKWVAGLSALASTCLFREFVGAWEDRHLLVNLPVLVSFSAIGAAWLYSQVTAPRAVKATAAACALAVVIVLEIHGAPVKRHYGFDIVAQDLLAHSEFKNSVFLVCAGEAGEGMLISEVAQREARPGHIVLRATKMLSSSDWMGYTYRAVFQSSEDTLRFVEDIPAGVIVIDGAGRDTPHGRLLWAGLRAHPEKWDLLEGGGTGNPSMEDPGDKILVYRLRGQEGRPPNKIRIPMESSGYGTFETQ